MKVVNVLVGGLLLTLGVSVALVRNLDSPAQAPTSSPIARQKGINAFFALDRGWDRKSIIYAAAEIERGEAMDADEPWILIAKGKLYMTVGYKSHRNVDAGAVDEAFALAKQAVKKSPNDAIVQSFYASRLYDKGKNEKAWEALQHAIKSEPTNPYPLYSVANKIAEARDAKSLEAWLAKAKAVDATNRYKDWQIDLDRQLCNLKRDTACVDAKYREEIALDPSDPWAHGNYASFLKNNKRYKESKAEYERALAIMEYGMARMGLTEVDGIIKSQPIGHN